MEGTNAEDDDLPKHNKEAEHKQRQKSIATRHPSQTSKISKVSLSRKQHFINEQKQAQEKELENGGIDECYEIAGESLGLIPTEGIDDSEGGVFD